MKTPLILSITFLLLSACTVSGSPAPPTVNIITLTPSNSPAPLPTLTPSPSPTPSITPTPTATPCQETAGKLIEYPYPENSAFKLTLVYLPPCYGDEPDRRYPVIYVIHGSGGGPNSWFYGDTHLILDKLISEKRIEPVIMVSPFLPYSYFSEKPWLTGELIPLIDATFRTKDDRLYRGLAGRSAGGGEAQWQAFQHPEVFGALQLVSSISISDHQPLDPLNDLIGYDAFLPAIPDAYLPHIYLDIGDEDRFLQENLDMVKAFREHNLPVTFSIQPGGHDQEYWLDHFAEYMRWFDSIWGIQAERK